MGLDRNPYPRPRSSGHVLSRAGAIVPPRARRMAVSLERALADSLVRFLTQEVRSYHRRIPNNLDNLKKDIRPGDVLRVEGKTRVAQAIKYVTQSSGSHSTIYVGEQPIQPGGPH